MVKSLKMKASLNFSLGFAWFQAFAKGAFLAFFILNALPAAYANIDVSVTSPNPNYIAGQTNLFTFYVDLAVSNAEYVDRFQFVFPAGITVLSGIPASGGGNCGTNDGIQAICSPVISWKTGANIPCNGAFIPTQCGVYNNVSLVFKVTAIVPANFTGPMTVTLNSTGDGYPSGVSSTESDDIVFQYTPPCNAPGGLLASNVSYSSFALAFNSVSGAGSYQTRIRPANGSWEEGVWAPDLSVIWQNAVPCTAYECQVRSDCGVNQSQWSSSIMLTTTGCNDPYCYSYGISSNEWIQNVQFGAISNNSGNNNGYQNFTNLSTTIVKGQSQSITITPKNVDNVQAANFLVWVDFNHDNDFNDPNEMVIAATGNDETPLSGVITVPANAVTANTRMRVEMAVSQIQGPCDIEDYRDVEDYTINIVDPPYLNVAPSTINVNANSGNTLFVVSSNCPSWAITGAPTWLSVSTLVGSNNSTVNLIYTENNTGFARMATLTVSGCNITKTVTLTQQAHSLNVTPTSFTVAPNNGSLNVALSSDCNNWTVTGAPVWLTVSPLSGSGNANLTLTYTTNTGSDRAATLTVAGCGITKTVTLTQQGLNFTVSPATILVTYPSGNSSISVSTNCNAWNITGAPSWLTVNPSSGSAGNTNVSLFYSANNTGNQRVATLNVSSCGVVKSVTLTQFAASMTVSPQSLDLGYTSGSANVAVSSNCTAWTVTGLPVWLTATPSGGSGNANITFNYTANTSGSARTAVVTISGCGITKTIIINQAFVALNANPTTFSVGYQSGSSNVTIASNCPAWTITGAPAWLLAVPSSGNGNATVGLFYSENSTGNPRTATLQLSGCGITQTITLTQDPVIFSLTPPNLTVGYTSGNSSVKLTSNCASWTISGMPAWLTVTPTSGSGNTYFTLNYQENNTGNIRTATLKIAGCGKDTSFVLTQESSKFLNVSPDTLKVGALSGSSSISVSSNCAAWNVSETASWFSVNPISGANNGIITLNFDANNSGVLRSDVIKVSGCGYTKTVVVIQNFLTITGPWTVVPTGENHTIILPKNMPSDIAGTPLQTGDWIGVFYDSSGVSKCGGYAEWKIDSSTAIAAFGNDGSLPTKNGFNPGEIFKVKVWKKSVNQVFNASVQYAPVGNPPIVTHTNAYAKDGISMLSAIQAAAGNVQAVPIAAGWNLISSYIVPDFPNMLDVFEDIAPNIVIVKDENGKVAIPYPPANAVNTIGNWNVLKAYQVKANLKDTLLVFGTKVVPENTPMPIVPGWQFISYLRTAPMNVETIFNGIISKIDAVKSNDGKVYLPQSNINTLIALIPGQGYRVKANAATTLVYQANVAAPDVALRPAIVYNLKHFVLDSNLNTGNNAILVFPDTLLVGLLHNGDEIGVFNQKDTLCGAAIYNGSGSLAVTAWGDDPTTNTQIEGMTSGEFYKLKVWKSLEQKEYNTTYAFSDSSTTYLPDAIEFATQLMLKDISAVQMLGINRAQLEIFPNPTSGEINLKFTTAHAAFANISVFRMDGALVLNKTDWEIPAGEHLRKLNLPQNLPSGTYLLKIQYGEETVLRKIQYNN